MGENFQECGSLYENRRKVVLDGLKNLDVMNKANKELAKQHAEVVLSHYFG